MKRMAWRDLRYRGHRDLGNVRDSCGRQIDAKDSSRFGASCNTTEGSWMRNV